MAARDADERAAHELFSGYAAILDLREQLKRTRGAFDLKGFHEQFLSYGNAPVQRDSRADARRRLKPRATSVG